MASNGLLESKYSSSRIPSWTPHSVVDTSAICTRSLDNGCFRLASRILLLLLLLSTPDPEQLQLAGSGAGGGGYSRSQMTSISYTLFGVGLDIGGNGVVDEHKGNRHKAKRQHDRVQVSVGDHGCFWINVVGEDVQVVKSHFAAMLILITIY